jgi:DNA-binding MarR family transcriptional regulator
MTEKLKRELKQRRAFSSVHEEVVLSAVRTADVLVQPFNEVARAANLSLSQYNVLRILRGAGEEELPCGEIAERMVSRDPDLTRLLDRLETRGLIERTRGTADRRKVLAKITKEGLDLLASLDQPIREATVQALGHMPIARLNELAALLDEARARGGE